MANPVVALPEVREFTSAGSWTSYMRIKRAFRQKRPYNLVLPYYYQKGTARNFPPQGDAVGSRLDASSMLSRFDERNFAGPSNEAFEKLKGKVYTQMQLANDLIEGGQTVDMIVKAARTLIDAKNALRRGDSRAVKRLLKVPKDFDFSKASKRFADLWLELHFGWQPLLEEIHSGLEFLITGPPVYEKFSAKASRLIRYNRDSLSSTGSVRFKETETQFYSVKCGLIVRGVRDRTFTLEQLGLMNPAAIAWEAVPYSFFVDYILNVGEVLSSYTAFSGLDLAGTYTTQFYEGHLFGSATIQPGRQGSWPGFSDWSGTSECVFVTRSSGLPSVTLQIRSFKVPSKTRLATVGSVLTQIFRK